MSDRHPAHVPHHSPALGNTCRCISVSCLADDALLCGASFTHVVFPNAVVCDPLPGIREYSRLERPITTLLPSSPSLFELREQ